MAKMSLICFHRISSYTTCASSKGEELKGPKGELGFAFCMKTSVFCFHYKGRAKEFGFFHRASDACKGASEVRLLFIFCRKCFCANTTWVGGRGFQYIGHVCRSKGARYDFLLPTSGHRKGVNDKVGAFRREEAITNYSCNDYNGYGYLYRLIGFNGVYVCLRAIGYAILYNVHGGQEVVTRSFHRTSEAFFLVCRLVGSFNTSESSSRTSKVKTGVGSDSTIRGLPLSYHAIVAVLRCVGGL